MKSYQSSGVALTAIAACLAAGALSGCNPASNAQNAPAPSASLPLAMDATPVAIAPAPTVSGMPPAAPVRVGRLANRDDEYAYADQAYEANEAFGDAPPDYAIDYDGTRPWVWRGDDQSTRVAEPLPGGGYRYYYYEPGAQYPYLVRDPEYTYGYDSGALVVVYDRYGRPVPNYNDRDRVDAASRILARAALLFAASQQSQHQAVHAANWQARQGRIDADNQRWAQAQQQQPDWNAYHAAHQQQESSQWGDERYRREAEAARFAQQTNQPQVAQRDWQAAQQAHAQAPAQPSGPSGLHLGGPKPPAPAATQNSAPNAPAGPPAGAAAGPAAGPANTPPAGAPGSGPGRHDHQPGQQGPNQQGPNQQERGAGGVHPAFGGPAPTQPAAPVVAGAPKPSGPAVGNGEGRHDHGLGPQGAGAGSPHPTAGVPLAARPAAPLAPPPAAVRAEPPKPKLTMPVRPPQSPAFHPPVQPQAQPRAAAAPPALFEHHAPPPMPTAPVRPQAAPVIHAPPAVVHAPPPVAHAAPPASPLAAAAKPAGDRGPPHNDKTPRKRGRFLCAWAWRGLGFMIHPEDGAAH